MILNRTNRITRNQFIAALAAAATGIQTSGARKNNRGTRPTDADLRSNNEPPILNINDFRRNPTGSDTRTQI